MKIVIGCDHGGFELKTHVIKYLKEQGIELFDFGTYTEDSCDYPDVAEKVAKAVANGEYEKGILICGTGIGISIAANKVDGIRAALCGDVYSAKMTRKHNDANILALGGRVVSIEKGLKLVDIFLNTPFEGGRHQQRIDMITAIENGEM